MNNITKIYLVTNCYGDPNKVYIGKTIASRKKYHIKTYGKQIIYDYIDEVNSLDRKIWTPIECFWIEQFRQWGFEIVNINKKGGGGREFFTEEEKRAHKICKLGFKHSEETKKRMSENQKGKYLTQESKDKISKANKGRKHSIETTKLRQSLLKGKTRSNEQKQNYTLCKINTMKKVFQYDLEGNFIKEWESKNQAARWLKEITGKTTNIQSQIKDCCNGRSKKCYGYIWKWN